MEQIAMRAMKLENLEARRQSAPRRGFERSDDVLDLGQRQLARNGIAFLLGDGARPDGTPRLLLAVSRQGLRPVPGPRHAGAPAGMADLDRRYHAMGAMEIGDTLQTRNLRIFPDAGAA